MSQIVMDVGLPRNRRDVASDGDIVRASFSRHETFHPRYGWLKKGFDVAQEHPDVFIRPDATVLLGVGKNMVRAIRYWCSAFKVLKESPDPLRPRMRVAHPTEFGRQLLGEDGWDPYLEHPGSLWLLHWNLVQPPSTAPAWFAAFNLFEAVEFTDQDLFRFLREFTDSQRGWDNIVDASLKKDVNCLLRMYAGGQRGQDLTSEETLDSPFVDLGLIRRTTGTNSHYLFPTGERESLPPEVVGYAALAYMSSQNSGAKTMSARRLAYERGSPGRVFRLSESEIVASLESLATRDRRVSMTRVAGVAQVVSHHDPSGTAIDIVVDFYTKLGGRL